MSHQVQIPDIGDRLKLSVDWKFRLFHEYRNGDLWLIKTGCEYRWDQNKEPEPIDVTLPAQTVLIVDRVYIRKGAKDFSSLSFRIDSCPNKEYERKRFWAKITDVNTMIIDKIDVSKIYTLDFWEVSYFNIGSRATNLGTTYPADKTREPANWIDRFIYVIMDNHPPIFKVTVNLQYKDYEEKSLWTKPEIVKKVSHVEYTLKDLNGYTICTTTSLDTLKKEARKAYKEKVNSAS